MTPDSRSFSAHITAMTPLAPAIQAWEIYLNDQDSSPYTVKAFTGDLQLLVDFLSPDQTIGAITTNDLNRFLNWLQDGRGVPCSPKSLARRVTSVKAFFRWLHNIGVVLVNPAEKVVQQSVISPLPVVLTAEEQAKVIEVTQSKRLAKKPDARPYALLALLLATAIKKGECLAINLNHIDVDSAAGAQLFVRYPQPRNRYKERKIELPPDWVASYQEYLAQYRPDDRLFPWSPRRLEYLLEDIGNEAGLDKHLSFDMCRWTSVLNDWQEGVEHEKIRQKLGVSKIQWREISMKLRQLAGDEAPAAS